MSDTKEEVKIPEQFRGIKANCHDLKLFDSHVEITMPNGMVKAIGLGDFVAILSKTMTEQEQAINTVLLPAGCFLMGQTLTDMKISCYYTGKVREVDFAYREGRDDKRGTKKFQIPFPNVIISHKLQKKTDHWMHVEAKYFATSRSVTEFGNDFIWERDYGKQIWALPLGNIYPEAKLCQGGNTIPRGPYKDNFRGLDWHYAVLYSSPFNNDLQIPSLRNGGMYCETWFMELEKHKTFPYELLIEGKKVTTTRMSTGQAINADNVDWLGAAINQTGTTTTGTARR